MKATLRGLGGDPEAGERLADQALQNASIQFSTMFARRHGIREFSRFVGLQPSGL